jgi:hypothetical protein
MGYAALPEPYVLARIVSVQNGSFKPVRREYCGAAFQAGAT